MENKCEELESDLQHSNRVNERLPKKSKASDLEKDVLNSKVSDLESKIQNLENTLIEERNKALMYENKITELDTLKSKQLI